MRNEKASVCDKYYTNELILSAQNGDKDALAALVVKNKPLVISIAKRYYYLNENFEDLVQIGSIGLIKAIKRFDTSYNTQFSTYAVYVINGELKKYFRDNGFIKTGRTLKELYIKIRAYKNEFYKTNGIEPGIMDIAANLGVDVSRISEAMDVCSIPEYIESVITDESSNPLTLASTISDKKNEPETEIELIDLKNVISSLDKDERQLVVLRYFKNLTQRETGEIMQRSQVQISRMEKKILESLKIKMAMQV